jgi:hypothetical protein
VTGSAARAALSKPIERPSHASETPTANSPHRSTIYPQIVVKNHKYKDGEDPGDNEGMYMGFNEDIVRWTGDGVDVLLPPLQDRPGWNGRNGFGISRRGNFY